MGHLDQWGLCRCASWRRRSSKQILCDPPYEGSNDTDGVIVLWSCCLVESCRETLVNAHRRWSARLALALSRSRSLGPLAIPPSASLLIHISTCRHPPQCRGEIEEPHHPTPTVLKSRKPWLHHPQFSITAINTVAHTFIQKELMCSTSLLEKRFSRRPNEI